MTRTRILILLLLLAVPALVVCAGASSATGLQAAGTHPQEVELDGYAVFSPEGRWLGEVDGVLASSATGEVDYIVLSYRVPRVYGRALMVTNPHRFVVIPWRLFTPLPEEERLELDADEMTLIPAPYLVREPELLSPEVARVVDDYWHSATQTNR